ncbi:uncharacterized protein LOC108477398 [Gossypium arboreum]|uniref:uncharacterized protein LOC108477398 n=1 Tax=Gossypium arboreum TaxID=29729 RepID=UPI0008197B0D|nr:uncharacterized protein LOC108477398 [Gossypium arboreum]
MLRILERVVEANAGFGGRGSVTERLRLNGAKIFRGITRVATSVAEYWMEATERIMDDLDFTDEQKLNGAMSLLRDESKYVEASYINTRRREFPNLTQGDHSVVEYEADFLRLSHYVRDTVVTEYERCVRFENSLKDNLRVLIAPQREREFAVLVEKAKITEEVKLAESQNREKRKVKRDSGSSGTGMRPSKKARSDGPVRVGPIVAPAVVAICQLCNRRHPGECWRSTGACLRYGSTEHQVKDCLLRCNQMQAPATETA